MKITQFILIILLLSPIFLIIILKSPTAAEANMTYRKYKVDIYINQDSTFIVEEKIDIFVDNSGNSNGISRVIPIDSSNCGQYDKSLTCGGFDFLVLESVEIDGMELGQDQYEKAIIQSDSGKKLFKISKRTFREESYVKDFNVSFRLRYKVYGGIRWITNIYGKQVPFFYWHVLPETPNAIQNAEVSIHFPYTVDYNPNSLIIYSSDNNLRKTTSKVLQNEFTMRFTAPVDDSITISYEFTNGEIEKTSRLYINKIYPQFTTTVSINGEPVDALQDDVIEFMPKGEYKFEFSAPGYFSQTEKVKIGSEDTVINVNLEPKPWMRTLLILLQILIYIGIALGIYYAYKDYRRIKKKSKDAIAIKTIVPQFKPPSGIAPYMLGSLSDERVDSKDITGTLIDLIYRGHLKIKKLPDGHYELTRIRKNNEFFVNNNSNSKTMLERKLSVPNLFTNTSDKGAIVNALNSSSNSNSISKVNNNQSQDINNYNLEIETNTDSTEIDSLNKIEKGLMDAIFEEKMTIKISSIKSDIKFLAKMKVIIQFIYDEMVSRGFFTESPEQVRKKYVIKGVEYLIVGSLLSIFISFCLTFVIGVWQIFTLFSNFFFVGIVNILMSNKIPAKTELGSKVYAEILGFKMYLESAERYRLQNLEPKDYEKYLSFAVVLGVEKQWAKIFKNVYNYYKSEWFEGKNFNSIDVAILARDFANSLS